MKNFLLSLISTSLLFLSSCTSENKEVIAPTMQVPPTAQQLASNADFADLVMLTHNFGDIIYNNLRDARSEKLRATTSKRLNALSQYINNKDSLTLGFKLLGFKDLNQFATNFNRFSTLRAKLNKSGIKVQSLPPDLILEAFELVSKVQKYAYPNIFTSSYVRGGGGICYDCHFNNCDECGGHIGDTTIPTDPDGPGYPHACIQRAQARRASRIETQNIILFGALTGCEVTGAGVGGAVCTGTIWFPPLGVAAGVAGFCITTGGCAFFAYSLYTSEVNTIEIEYQQDRAACF